MVDRPGNCRPRRQSPGCGRSPTRPAPPRSARRPPRTPAQAAPSTSISITRSASTVEARSATATRIRRCPKSMPSAAPADGASRRNAGRRPRLPASLRPESLDSSTINPRSWRSAISVVTVVRERPVRRARSDRLALPRRRRASITRDRFELRKLSREPKCRLPPDVPRRWHRCRGGRWLSGGHLSRAWRNPRRNISRNASCPVGIGTRSRDETTRASRS